MQLTCCYLFLFLEPLKGYRQNHGCHLLNDQKEQTFYDDKHLNPIFYKVEYLLYISAEFDLAMGDLNV